MRIMSTPVSWIKNLLVIIISITLSISFLEISLRFIYPDKVKIVDIRDHSDPLMPKHKLGSYRFFQRNTVATFDANGMRINPNQCGEIETVNALLVGDSNIAGRFLDDTETLGARITEHSLLTDLCINVDIFGVSGFGPDQSLFAIDKLTKVQTYDYVIFHMFADNDLGDLIRNNYYDQNNNQLSNDGYCYLEKPLLERFILFKALRKTIYSMNWGHNLYGKVKSSNGSSNDCVVTLLINDSKFSVFTHKRAQLDWQLNRGNQRQVYMNDRYDIEFACDIDTKIHDYVSQYLKRIINEVDKLSNNRNFNLIYLIQPSEYDVTKNHPEVSDKGCDSYNPQNLTKIFENALDGKNVINLYENFFECNTCYFSEEELGGDSHWSPHGINIASRYIINLIHRNQTN